MPLTILVLENPWASSAFDGLSAVPFVEGLAKYSDGSIRVLTKPFYQAQELGHWLKDFRRRKPGVGQRILYVAAHGTRGRVGGLPNGTKAINFHVFNSLLRSAGHVDGVHLGCCDFGNWDNAERILRPDTRRKHSVPCRWVAGYDRYVDWFQSMLVDLIFWRELLRDPRHDAWRACLRTYKQYPKSHEIGFSVFRNGPRGRLERTEWDRSG